MPWQQVIWNVRNPRSFKQDSTLKTTFLFFSRNFNKNQWWCYCKACCCLLLRFFFCMIGKTEPEQWQQWQIFIAFFLKYDCKVLISSIKILEVCASISMSKGAVKKWSIFVRKMRWTSKLNSNFKEITSGVDLTVIEKFDPGKTFQPLQVPLHLKN